MLWRVLAVAVLAVAGSVALAQPAGPPGRPTQKARPGYVTPPENSAHGVEKPREVAPA